MAKKAVFDSLRTLAFGGISGTYAAVGTAFTHPVRIMTISNQTDGDLIFSTDDTNADGNVFLFAGEQRTYDFTANMIPGKDDSLVLPVGTEWFVKESTAVSSGGVTIEAVYAE
jgi:hypothetical protein